jgi:hypothetical protein
LVFRVEPTRKWTEAEEEITGAVLKIPLIRRNVEANLMDKPKVVVLEQLHRLGTIKQNDGLFNQHEQTHAVTSLGSTPVWVTKQYFSAPNGGNVPLGHNSPDS